MSSAYAQTYAQRIKTVNSFYFPSNCPATGWQMPGIEDKTLLAMMTNGAHATHTGRPHHLSCPPMGRINSQIQHFSFFFNPIVIKTDAARLRTG